MRRLPSPPPKVITIPRRLQRMASRVSDEIISTKASPPRDFITKYTSVFYADLEEQRRIRQCDAELITTAHRGAKALISYDITNPLLTKQHIIPALEALRHERPRTVGLRKHQDISILHRAYAQIIDRVQSRFLQSGFLRVYDDTAEVLAPSEARGRMLAQQRMAHYRILELEYMEQVHSLHEHLSPHLVEYTNRAERRHHLLIQSIANQSIENLFVSPSTLTLFKSVQNPCDDTPVILFQCRLEDAIRGDFPVADPGCKQTTLAALTTNDLISISELAQIIASEQSTEFCDSAVHHPTVKQSSQTYTDMLTLGKYLSTLLVTEESNSRDALELVASPNNDNLSVCSINNEEWEPESSELHVGNAIIDRLPSPNPLLCVSQQDFLRPEYPTQQARRPSLKSPATKLLSTSKYTKSGLPLPQSRLGTKRASRLNMEADLSSLDHSQCEPFRTSNPILAKRNCQKVGTVIEPLIGKAIQSPPTKPRTVSRISLVRSPSPPVHAPPPPLKDLQACTVPLTKVTFQLGSPGVHLSEPGAHPIREPFSESESFALEGFDILEDLPQSQGYHLRARAPLNAHIGLVTHQDDHMSKSMHRFKRSPPRSPTVESPTLSGTKLRDRFGSPLLALSTKRLNTEVVQVLRCREYLQLCISQYRKLVLYGEPFNYSAGFTYTSWLIDEPIGILEIIQQLVPSWPNMKSHERLQKIRRVSPELLTTLPKRLIWMNPAYKEPFHDIQDLCFSILWMLTGDYAPSWYVPSSKAMKRRRADMNRRLLLDIGAIDRYDERQVTQGMFTQLVLTQQNAISRGSASPLSRAKTAIAIRSRHLEASDSSHDLNDPAISSGDMEGHICSATLQELYYKRVPAVRRFHFPKNWIVYGAHLESSIPYYYESLDFVFAELKSKNNRGHISIGPVIECAIKHEKNDTYDPLSNLDYMQARKKRPAVLGDAHDGEESYVSDDVKDERLDHKLYLLNGGVTPYVSPCFSESNSFINVGSESCTPSNRENPQFLPSPDSEISLLYEDGDIGIKGCPLLQSEHYSISLSISELTEMQGKAAKAPIASMSTPSEDWTDTFLQHVIHELEIYSKEQVHTAGHVHNYSGRYAALNMQIVSAGRSVSGCTQSTTRGTPPTTLHVHQIPITSKLLTKPNEPQASSPVARILDHPLDFTNELSASEQPTTPTHHTNIRKNKLIEATESRAYDSRELQVMGVHYPNRRALRKGCYVNLQFLADFSYFKESEERRREISNAYPLDPDMYITDSTIRAYYDEPLLLRYHFQDTIISAGVYIVTQNATQPSTSMTFVDGLSDSDLIKFVKDKKMKMQQERQTPHLYLPFVRTILKDIGAIQPPEFYSSKPNINNISTNNLLLCKPDNFDNSLSRLQVSQKSITTADNTRKVEPQATLLTRELEETTKVERDMLKMSSSECELEATQSFMQQAFELSDNSLLTLFSLRVSNIKEIINNLLHWVETVHTTLMLDGRALLSSICGSSYWADVTNSSLELEKRSRKERFAAMYRRHLHSRDVRNVPEIAYPEGAQANAETIDNLQLFELKRENAIRFLRLANRMYAEYVAEAIIHVVCQVIIPAIKSIISLIVKEAMAMMDLARLTVSKYMSYLKEAEPDYTVLIKINTDYLETLEYCEKMMSQIFWLFRHVKCVDNSLVTTSYISETDGQGQSHCFTMPKVIIQCIPSMQAAWNVCKLMFIKARVTLNAGMQCLVKMPETPTLPKYAFTPVANPESAKRPSQHNHIDIVFGHSNTNLSKQYSTLQLEYALKKDTRPHIIAELSQFEYLLPENSFSGGLCERQLWPFHKYGYYHLLHNTFKHFDDRLEPLKTLVSEYDLDTPSAVSLMDGE
ncbi:hypothetical protein QR46_2974 [Giardia duodenalis assemblage B]|uniref:Uncharacterized protein n=1 Tax=Giardia duodenalis assemblage B TaxID=1394984 RepID=A0A132NSH4_GIAIN|nr:hypothetical protein QR46_2974 [Giardia intestinalis assemblage B]